MNQEFLAINCTRRHHHSCRLFKTKTDLRKYQSQFFLNLIMMKMIKLYYCSSFWLINLPLFSTYAAFTIYYNVASISDRCYYVNFESFHGDWGESNSPILRAVFFIQFIRFFLYKYTFFVYSFYYYFPIEVKLEMHWGQYVYQQSNMILSPACDSKFTMKMNEEKISK